MIAPPSTADFGPYRIDLVRAIWWRVDRVADVLHAVGAIRMSSKDLDRILTASAAAGMAAIEHPDLHVMLIVLAAQDQMHSQDWLRMRAYEAGLPRRKPPASVDLQLRLKNLECIRLVATVVHREDEDDTVRVTIKNVRGDVASVESENFANALEGAMKMAGARLDAG